MPEDAQVLLGQVNAPPRLIAHLILVHDVAAKLVEEFSRAFPESDFDKQAVLFGAATHDIGKAIHNNELKKPGKLHEEYGRELLKQLGVSEDRARFAFTHGNCVDASGIRIEDLLVALADHTWKGKRSDELESLLVEVIVREVSRPAWECFAVLDEIVQKLAAGADERLAWMAQFPAEPK